MKASLLIASSTLAALSFAGPHGSSHAHHHHHHHHHDRAKRAAATSPSCTGDNPVPTLDSILDTAGIDNVDPNYHANGLAAVTGPNDLAVAVHTKTSPVRKSTHTAAKKSTKKTTKHPVAKAQKVVKKPKKHTTTKKKKPVKPKKTTAKKTTKKKTTKSTPSAVTSKATSVVPAVVSQSTTATLSIMESMSASVETVTVTLTSSTTAVTDAVLTAAAPAPTGTGTVSGCTEWYVAVSGDYCYLIAQNYDLNVDTFMAWNPSVNPPACNTLYAGYAYCVAITPVQASSEAVSVATSGRIVASSVAASWSGTSTVSPTASQPTANANGYVTYTGDGTVAQGWPSQDQWVTYDQMWAYNVPIMQQSCSNWDVAADSTTEIGYMNSSILSISASTGIDPRFILAIIMQESNGCVRVITTSWSVQNPGLMQSHDGAGSCNRGGVIQNPCPQSEIFQMIQDGTEGTSSGDGLQQCLAETNDTTVAMYYKAARIYNGGLSGYNSADLGSGCCTLCYSSDVANRLMGWHTGNSGCTL